ncbi:hypothetical protein [Dermatobacter hominis]|uniref:hypothetical protein n=1 Tax=Dermatobacter hominis TaxID=2884263 RepID=UPI001D10DD5D|nr:hypothetical protein [Dermatobacter hominis]UDY35010.1 hypothetical protein LH044_16930 [Dermatobacter hominis]
MTMAEEVLADCEKLLKWDAPKRKQTVFSAKLGRLVVTDERVVFLSTGSNDLTIGKALASGFVSPIVGTMSSSTGHLDEGALANDGSLVIPLGAITKVEVKGMFKALTIGYRTSEGERFASLAPKNGGIPGGDSWVELIEGARARLQQRSAGA